MRKQFILTVCLFLFINVSIGAVKTQPIVAQYFGLWTDGNQWEDKFRNDTPFDQLNRLYISFGKLIKNERGEFSLGIDGEESRVRDLIARTRAMNPNAEIFITVGGNGSSDSFGGASRDPSFARNVISFLRAYGMNGFDIDWEISIDRNGLNNLVTNLYSPLHAEGFKLTLDVWQFVHSAYDMGVLRENLDQINIMSYGTGLSLKYCAENFARAGFPLNKIIGGIESETGFNQFGGVTDSLGDNGSIAEKARYTLNNGLAGMMGWRMDNDYVMKEKPGYPTYQGAKELWKYMTRN